MFSVIVQYVKTSQNTTNVLQFENYGKCYDEVKKDTCINPSLFGKRLYSYK